MFGTAMIARTKADPQDLVKSLMDWRDERAPHIDGFVSAGIVVGDDGRVVNYAEFESKEAYAKLADDPEQDRWYHEHIEPLLDGEPEWVDGEWAVMPPVAKGKGRKMIDCGLIPSESNCTLMIAGTADEVVRAAAAHAVDVHGHTAGPELEAMLRGALQDA